MAVDSRIVIADSHEKARVIAETLLTGARAVLGFILASACAERGYSIDLAKSVDPRGLPRALVAVVRPAEA